jgi:uncharacterized integral membrane protein
VWYVKAFVLLVVVVAVLLFALANSSQQVEVRWWNPDAPGTAVNLAFALLAAYVLGVLTFFVVSIVREVRWRGRCARLRREADGVRQELNALRTAPLEGPLGGAGESPAETADEAGTNVEEEQ